MGGSNHERHSEYECDLCGKKLKDLSEYNQHKLTHVLTQLCSNSSNDKDSFKEPFRSDTGTTTDYFRQSESAFGTSIELAGTGKKISEVLEPFFCLLCRMKFLSREQLKRHSHVCTGHKSQKCPHCNQPHSGLVSVNRCMLSHNMGSSGSKTVSEMLGSTAAGNEKGFQTDPSKYLTERKFECTLCGERFTNPKSLELHVKGRHVKVDSLIAEYKRKKLLDELATKEYKCEVCSLRCRDEFTLQRHNDMYHADVHRINPKYKRNDIPHKIASEEHKCEICGNICDNAFNLKFHKLMFHPISNDQRNDNAEDFATEGSATYEPRPTISAGSTTHELEHIFPAGSTPYGPIHNFSTGPTTYELPHNFSAESITNDLNSTPFLGYATIETQGSNSATGFTSDCQLSASAGKVNNQETLPSHPLSTYSHNSLENECRQPLFGDFSKENKNEPPPSVFAGYATDESNARPSAEKMSPMLAHLLNM